MTHRNLTLALALLTALLSPSLASSAAGQAFTGGQASTSSQLHQEMNRATVQELVELVQAFLERDWIVGAELMVVQGDETVLHQGFGWRDKERGVPMERGTRFNLRSMTKPLVGTLAQRMIDGGALALSDPVAKYLPAFESGASAAITIEHLLTHTSGLPDGNPAGRPSDYPTLRSIADYWGTHGPTVGEPGTTFMYSDPGVDVLGAVLESISRRTLDQLADTELFQPLGMTNSSALISREESQDPTFCSTYQRGADGGWTKLWEPGDGSQAPFTIGSGTTWYSTAEDYARFLSVWMRGQPWLSEAAVKRALEPRHPMDYANQIPGVEVRYGQMWQVYVDPGQDPGERPVMFGHSGSDGTYAWVWPEEEVIILYLTQSRGQRTRLMVEERFGDLFSGAS